MTRGELWWADFGIPFGSKPGFRRPVLVVQDDTYTQSRINTVVVAPLTTNLILEEAPGNVFLSKAESSLAKDSVIVVTQLSAIDKKRLVENIGKAPQETMEDVKTGITMVLGIE
ncbi:MAG: type II toxin-antitoxin system PemK/MazF family toxin [Spirochaeta sp.]|jgi:mRNA interferase MazF|nr:type II toxin-antitoxin system PemK/MazF family toxin [Spirochaeta sp.]